MTREELLLELEKRPIPQELLEAKEQAIAKYTDFFGITLQREFKIYMIHSREEMDIVQDKKTEDWVVGHTRDHGTKVFIFDPEHYEKETGKTQIYFKKLLKHEIAHVYVRKIIDNNVECPKWLNEGLAYYLANQQISNNPIEGIVDCIDYYEKFIVEHYGTSGRLVTLLITKYGKEKILVLLKSFKNKEEFYNAFKEIYGFELTKENLIKNLKE
jgi:hypothetical protein